MALLAALPGVSEAAEFPLKRVVLSTSGLAQFTHSGSVTAGAVIELPVRLDQVDDVLKSLTVFDSAGRHRRGEPSRQGAARRDIPGSALQPAGA